MTSKPPKAAGLLYGPEMHHLDHLAVVCCLMDIPLICTEEEIAAAAQKYYPDLEVIHWNYLQIADKVVQHYDIIFYSIPRPLFDEIFFFAQQFQQKNIHTIWCPHGNSDKGNKSYFMEALAHEEVALVYGPKMIDFLIRKKVFDQLQAHVVFGNLRYQYYRRHKPFFDRIVNEEITSHLKSTSRIILYAPTWQDTERSSSFFEACPILVEKLPENCSLIIKLHPNLLAQEEGRAEKLIHEFEEIPNLLFMKQFPPIYPLLDYVDIYIGDLSSIGYDFLTFNKPMFFLNQNKRDSGTDLGLYLYRCGFEIFPEDYSQIYQIIDRQLPADTRQFSQIRKEVYTYTFGKEKKWEDLRDEIQKTYHLLLQDDL